MKLCEYKRIALGSVLAGALVATPALAHGPGYSSDDTSRSYSYSSNDEGNSFTSNEEHPQMSNDSNPAPTPESDLNAMNDQLQRDRDQLAEDLRTGASDDQIAQDQRAIEMDRQGTQETVAFNGDGTVVVIPGS
jgi:outer membrane murein-binding lipoprotein Lpp